MLPGLAVLTLLALLLGLGWKLRPWLRFRQPVVAEVNGEPITEGDLDLALVPARGTVVQDVIDRKLLEQEAAKLQIVCTEEELKPPPQLIDAREIAAWTAQKRAELLMKKMVSRETSDAEKTRIYRAFADELRQYELAYVLLNEPQDARLVKEALAKGISFEKVAQSYSADESTRNKGGRAGFMATTRVRKMFGPIASREIAHLAAGAVSDPVPTPYGAMIFKVYSIKRSYEDLLPPIEELLVGAKRLAVLDRLRSQAVITSRYQPVLEKLGEASASPTPQLHSDQ